MCGIAGIASLNDKRIEENVIKRMTGVLKHRGPDDEGIYLSPKVGLGHRRLSVIDLETGHQPMANEDETVWIVHNGEVYNFPELKTQLIEKGHRFRTKSDTEVIIHLYEEKNVKSLDDLRGAFAFSIWDAKNEKLFLARDRVGQKPLFYFYKEGIFIFASEIKSLLEHDIVKRELDLESLDSYLTYGYTPAPHTMFKGIRALPPAHYLVLDKNGLKIENYWNLSYARKTDLSFPECKERFYALLSEATRIRLISDVPLGMFLSGGVDSSCVVALMSKVASEKIKTFSIGFEEKDFDELRYARFIAERFGTDHKELIVKPKALEVLPKLAWHYDQPFGDSSAIPTYYVSKMGREFVKVALNGDGGDESMAGYQRYRGVKLAGLFTRLPRPLLRLPYVTSEIINRVFHSSKRDTYTGYARAFFGGLIENPGIEDAYCDWISFFTDKQKKSLYSKRLNSFLKKDTHSYLRDIIKSSDALNLVERFINADIKSNLPEDLTVKADMATMANSLEGRSPFLDHRLMEFAASFPIQYKLHGFTSKYILKEVFKKEIPLQFLNRKKKGFGVPVREWFAGELKGFVSDMLLGGKALKREIFCKSYVEEILKEHQERRSDHTNRIWALLSFEMWHRIFIDKEIL